MIEVLNNKQGFHLQSNNQSMVIGILPSGHVLLNYYGKKVIGSDFTHMFDDSLMANYMATTDHDDHLYIELYPQLYPSYGNPDLRTPAFMFSYENGSRISDFRFSDYKISKTKEKIPGLPTCLDENVDVLHIYMVDALTNVQLEIVISVFAQHDVFSQYVVVHNTSKEVLQIEKMMSLCMQHDRDDFEVIALNGAWARETHVSRTPICNNHYVVESKRLATGHGQNSFIALVDHDTTETSGEVYATNFMYSGNFICDVEVDMHQKTKLLVGINPFDFHWQLTPNESFYTPEVIMVYASQGLGQMSRTFHKFYQDVILPKPYAKKARPVLINNWEATYFDFNKETLLNIASEAKSLGVELFVLDDGWFGKRNSDRTSLGDWKVNEEKLDGTLGQLATKINALGLDFGLWVEPDMISEESELYQQHPEWVIRAPKRLAQTSRNQWCLDLCNVEVQNFIINMFDELFASANISYIKWDYNRNVGDCFSPTLDATHQKEFAHRYILGVYRILEQLTTNYPNILWEGCAGGGGRLDAGMLSYFSQNWTSDDTDAIERLWIQQGATMSYPPISMSCHVSASPNHQVGRYTSLKTRGIVAMEGNFGYELNVLNMTDSEKAEVKKQIELYKEIRMCVQNGTHYRIFDKANERSWQFVSSDGSQAVLSYVKILAHPNTLPKRLRFVGLEEDAVYRVTSEQKDYTGSYLMHIGLPLYIREYQDFDSIMIQIHKV